MIRVAAEPLGEFDAVMVTYSKSGRFAPEHGRRLFDYLRYKLFAVEKTDLGYRIRTGRDGIPVGFDPRQVRGFYEQAGRNTQYIIHPDEILADNLALLLTRSASGPSATQPADYALLRDLEKILAQPVR